MRMPFLMSLKIALLYVTDTAHTGWSFPHSKTADCWSGNVRDYRDRLHVTTLGEDCRRFTDLG